MCSFLAISKKVKTAFGLWNRGNFCDWYYGAHQLADSKLRAYRRLTGVVGEDFANIDLGFLQFIVFISVIAAFTQLTEMAVEKFSPALYGTLGIFLPPDRCKLFGTYAALFMGSSV